MQQVIAAIEEGCARHDFPLPEPLQQAPTAACAPTSAQRWRVKRPPSVARRTSMSTSSATHTTATVSAVRRDRREDDEGDDHRRGQVARVARADEDAVEREDDGGHRPHRAEQRPQLLCLIDDVGIVGEEARDDVGEREDDAADDQARRERQLEHAPRGGEGLVGVTGAQRPADDDLPGDGDGIESSAGSRELKGDLVGGDGGRADPRADGGGDTKHPATPRMRTRAGADRHERRMRAKSGDANARSSAWRTRPPRPAARARCPRPTRRAPVEAIDEQQLEHDVDHVGHPHEHGRRAQVAHPAQPALARRGDERHRHAERRDPQVAGRHVRDVAVAAERVRRAARPAPLRRPQGPARGERQPERLRPEGRGVRVLARAVQPGHAGRRAKVRKIRNATGSTARGRERSAAN